MFCEFSRSFEIEAQRRAARQVVRNAAIRHHASERAYGVRAPAEADDEYAVAVLVKADDRGVAINDICGDTETSGHACEVVDRSHPTDLKMTAVGSGAETGVVEGNLFGRIDTSVGSDPQAR